MSLDIITLGLAKSYTDQHGGGGGQVQPDWNQNNVSAPDYVKNRPFYTGDPVETVLLEERVVTFTDGWSDTSFNFDISVEDIVKVTWDGAEYTCIPTLDADGFSFGNEFLLNEECEDTGEPFWYEGEWENFYTQSSTDSHQIKVSKISKKVIQIDSNYIPNNNIRNGLGSLSTEEGTATTASGSCSHAEGSSTEASGSCSHAEGFMTKASGEYSHAEGKYNIEDTANNYAHIVGNGTSDTSRSNAHTLDWNGVGWFKGRPQFGGTAQDQGSQTVMANGDKEIILTSSTANSTKKFKITVDDSGTLKATEVTST